VVTVVGPLALAWLLMGPWDHKVDRRGDWAEFYDSHVIKFANIPAQASIVEATDMADFPMGGGFKVVFTLPDTKTPEEWMLELTTGGGVELREFKVSEHFYDASGKGWDAYWLRYFPEKKHYVLRYHWD
jgi:hypothetical protein